MLKTTAFIFARGGSKGVPGKNIRPLAGKPLLLYAIEAAAQSPYIERVVVSTDDAAIAHIAKAAGAQVPFMRPAELAADDSPEWLAWRHAIARTREIYGPHACDIFVSVPATCPFREPDDISRAIDALKNSDADIAITVSASHSNPYFTMVTRDEKGFARLAAKPAKPIARRQDAPNIKDIVGVAYAARPDFILKKNGLWEGRVAAVEVPPERALDIDTEHDFLLAELLMQHRLKQNA